MKFMSIVIALFLLSGPGAGHGDHKQAVELISPMEEIPVLCYHNITMDGRQNDAMWISSSNLERQLRTLKEKGFQSVSPDQLYEHMTHGKPLPPRPFMITFDDGHTAQYTIGAKLAEKFGFRAVFFIMTVTIGKKGFMDADQIRALSQAGHTIGAHTWDHHKVTGYTEADWILQVDKPRQTLGKITGKPVYYFAYPYGAMNEQAVRELAQKGFRSAYQLDQQARYSNPLFSIRRLMINGRWQGQELVNKLAATF